MRMPGIDRPPLSPHLEALRAAVMGLPLAERRQLMHALAGDISRANDLTHAENHARAERARKRPGQLQMSLDGVAA